MANDTTLQKICDSIIFETSKNLESILTLEQLNNRIGAASYPDLFRKAVIALWPREVVTGPNTSFVEATIAYASDEDNGHPYILIKKLAHLAHLSYKEKVPAGVFVEEVYSLMES